MAKVPHPKPKATSKALPPRSRLSRRAASPAPKSLTDYTPPSTHPTAHHTTLTGSISKRKSKAKPLTRSQRLRKQKGIERAEKVVEMMGRKVERSAGREGVRRGRRRGWEDVNMGIMGGKGEKGGAEGDRGKVTGAKGGGGKVEEWVDEESEDGEGDEVDRRIREAPVVVGAGDGVAVAAMRVGLKDGQGVGEEEEL